MSLFSPNRVQEASRWLLVLVAGVLTFLPARPTRAQVVAGWNRAVGGVSVQTDGVLRQQDKQDREEIVRLLRENLKGAADGLNLPAELRKISLRGIDAALREVQMNGQKQLPEEVKYLAGIQRVQYVLVYPEQQDIVLAGPGEGWKGIAQGHVVGVTTGRPVLWLADLLVALRSVESARTGQGISVSIEPSADGRRNFERFISQFKTFDPRAVAGAADALGAQQILLTGIPETSHVARVLVSADFHMKCLAMKLTESGVKDLPSYLDLLKAKRRTPTSSTPRWWMACNYEPLARSQDRLAWQLRGPGVKVLYENDFVEKDGTVRKTGKQDPTAREWAERMTRTYDELSLQDPVFGELRNVMDLCVVAALIKKENLTSLAGHPLTALFANQSPAGCDNLNAAKSTATLCSHIQIGRNFVLTASGGVDVDSWAVAAQSEVDQQVKQTHTKAAAPARSGWWWN